MAASAQITGNLYPILCDLGGADAREVSQFLTRSGVLRAARGQAAGPRDPKGRKSPDSSST